MDGSFNQLIQLLAASPAGFVSSRELAAALSVSQRTVFRYIKQLEQSAQSGGFAIESQKGRGYRLRIRDQALFERFGTANEESAARGILSNLILEILAGDGARLDDLAEQFSYSRSNISRFVAQAEEGLVPYGIRFDRKAYKGLLVVGDELAIRAAILRQLGPGFGLSQVAARLRVTGFDTVEALSVVEEMALSEGIQTTVENLQQFLYTALVCACRVGRGKIVSFDGIDLPRGLLLSSAQSGGERLRHLRGLHWMPDLSAEGENFYLSLAFEQIFFDVSRQRQRLSAHPDFYHGIVQGAFARILLRYNADFCRDEVLQNSLMEHVASSYGRYFIGQDLPNPYADAVQNRYPMAHYYTLELAEEITRRTRMPLMEGEIGYLTLHIASALVRSARVRRTAVAILCSTAFGTAALLKTRLLQQYNDVLCIEGVYSLEEAMRRPLPVSLYLSTVPVEFDRLHGKPVLQISPFLDQNHVALLDAALSKLEGGISLRQYFRREHFFYLERSAKKERVLDAVCGELIRRGELTAAERDAVLARENMVSTEIFPLVAMPHCLIRNQSFLCFAVLNQPVFWGKSKVRLVMLGCFQEQDARIRHLLTQLYRLLADDERIAQLLGCQDYDSFMHIIDAFIEGENTND